MRNQHIFASVAALALCITAIGANAQNRPEVYNPGIMLSTLSDNGAYALGSTLGDQDVDNPHGAGGTLIDLATKKQMEISAPSGWAEVTDVADNGIVVGSALGLPGYWTPATDEWTTFKVPAPWGGGCFTAVTPDAHYAVGYYTDAENVYLVAPMMYDLTNGERKSLSNLPAVDLTGQDRKMNVFYGVSPDGRYVLGQMSQSYLGDLDPETGEMRPALFTYVYDTVNDTWHPIGYTYDEATQKYTSKGNDLHYIATQYMSCDGAWVTGSAYLVRNGGEYQGGTEGYYPYRYEVATDNFEVYGGESDTDVAGNKITSDGTVLAASPMGNPYPTAQIRCGKFFISLDQIFQQVYGVSTLDMVHDSVTGAFEAISADGLTALMITYDNSYIITVPEPFADLAAKVDLLRNYTLNIPDGSTINRIAEVQITFDRAVECLNYPQNVRLLDSNGASVRSASGLSISRTNDHTVVVTFRSTKLTPGETYTVDIPADMIWLKDDTSIKAKAMQIHYVGREEGPVKVKKVSPTEGSAVAQFNSNPDYITVTFDTQVTISDKANVNLYNADDGTLITQLMATSQGDQAYFFPIASYNLYKGTNYKIVVDAGSVTDLSVSGGNEEFTLQYTGAYVRALSDDDIYIFNAPCDNYDNFLFWKDEFNRPAAIPQSWGFTEENIWLLVRDDEQSSDWALAAHSMFAPAAESNSWLITPQLYIPDANTYLAFNAQSYLKIRDDNLKVYIYTSDALYNYFSADLADAFKADGQLVIDEIVPAGETEEGLKDEWTRYTVDLAEYAGKNIYIAFVYNNFDKSAIFLDDIQVIRNMSFLLTNQTPHTVVDVDNINVSGLLSPGSEIADYTGVNLKLYDADGELVDEIVDADVNIKYGDVYKFSFTKPLDLTPGYEASYIIEVTSGNETSSFRYSVKDLIFEPVKRVVLEEFSGSACSNCPLGILAVENLLKLYPDNFIPVVMRTYTNDMYATGITDYTAFLGLTAAPSGRINRGDILMPMLQNGSAGYTFYGRGITMSDGNEAYLWADAVQDQLNEPAEVAVSFESSYDDATGDISIPCNVKFALQRNNESIGVFAVIVEDNLPTYQSNGFVSVSDPALGPWGVGGMYNQATVTSWQASEVARFVVNDRAFNGNPLPESDFTPGVDYSITLNATVPAQRLYNPENCRVVVMVIDRASGHILNAVQDKLRFASINDIISDDNATPEYYDLQGTRVDNPIPGHIYIKVLNGHASKIRMS